MNESYAVMAVTLIVWIGVFLYLLRLDAMVRELRTKK
ncbi:MAG: CcmD family protein [Armatimonadota bacterium]